MLGRTETRTRDGIYCQTMRTVRDISRDDRARIATCRLRTLIDRLKENYSKDDDATLRKLIMKLFLIVLASFFFPGLCHHLESPV